MCCRVGNDQMLCFLVSWKLCSVVVQVRLLCICQCLNVGFFGGIFCWLLLLVISRLGFSLSHLLCPMVFCQSWVIFVRLLCIRFSNSPFFFHFFDLWLCILFSFCPPLNLHKMIKADRRGLLCQVSILENFLRDCKPGPWLLVLAFPSILSFCVRICSIFPEWWLVLRCLWSWLRHVIPKWAVVSKPRDRHRILYWSISYIKSNWTGASNVWSELCDVRIRQYRLRVEGVISTLFRFRVHDVRTYRMSVSS